MGGRRDAAYIWTIGALVVFAGLALVPTPYYLIAPGTSVDLAQRIAVAGHAAPQRRFLLTDVTLARASVLLLAGRFWPGVRLVPRATVVPDGESAKSYDRVLVDAMSDSQNAAALVAERAAGYRVALPPRHVYCEGTSAHSHAAGILRSGDRIVRVAGRAIRSIGDIGGAIAATPGASRVPLDIQRDGRALHFEIATVVVGGVPRLGIFARERVGDAKLPVPVRFSLDDIAGSSGGLMFALQIYADLRGDTGGAVVAGTGTIGLDGRVGRIEGTQQKLIAAKRAGARTFLVPVANYPDIASERDVRVVPVATFRDALAALARAPR